MAAIACEEQRLLPPQKVVVTGGAGYIGSHLVDWLVGEGHQVTVLDDLSTGNAAWLAAPCRRGEVHLVTGSILDAGLVEREMAGAATVFHLAAAVGVGRIVADPLGSLRTNLIGTENVLGACARHGCRVVLASSSEVYGRPHGVPMSESGDRVLGPTTVTRWSYAAAKAVDEHLAFAYADEGLPVCVVRYFNSYGPRLDRRGDASVVAVFLRHALAGTPIPLHGTGQQTRSFTYVSDTVRGTVLAAAVPQAQGQVFNIGSARETRMYELAEMIVAAVGSRSPIQPSPYENVYGARFEDIPRRVPDISRARQVLGWQPQVSLEEGLKRTIAWWGEHDDTDTPWARSSGSSAPGGRAGGGRSASADAEDSEQDKHNGRHGERAVRDDDDQREVPLGGCLEDNLGGGLGRLLGRRKEAAPGYPGRRNWDARRAVDGDPAGEHGDPEQRDGDQDEQRGPGQCLPVEQQVANPHAEARHGKDQVCHDDGHRQPAGRGALVCGVILDEPHREHVQTAEGGNEPGDQGYEAQWPPHFGGSGHGKAQDPAREPAVPTDSEPAGLGSPPFTAAAGQWFSAVGEPRAIADVPVLSRMPRCWRYP